jgi:hypothetical protein
VKDTNRYLEEEIFSTRKNNGGPIFELDFSGWRFWGG